MKKKPFLIISLFLLLLSLSLLSYQLFKVPKEVEAVVGILDLYAQTTSTLNTPGGIWNSLGNVGIGTTAPTLKLTVGGGKIGLDGGQQIIFSDVDTTDNLKLQLWSGYGLGINGSTLFYTANGNHSWRDGGGTNERMLLTTAANGGLTVKGTGNTSFAGNVGIGTTAPGAKLHVSSGDTSLALFGPNTSWGGKLYVGASPNQALAATAQVISTDGNLHLDPAPSKNMYLGYYQARDIYINPNGGNVGIGTAAPTEKLTINSGNIQVNGTAKGIIFKEPGNTWYSSIYSWGELSLINYNARGILFATGPSVGQGITRMIISKNGNVGIGNSTDSYKLDVTGDVVARGQVYSSTYGWLSDERLKKNIQPIANPIETLMQINGKSFDWRKDEFSNRILPDGLQYGMIAQDVEKILPSVVTTMKDGFKTINYSSFTPFIIEAIKEQQIQIESLTKKTDNQQKQIDDLKKAIEELRKLLLQNQKPKN